MKNNKGITLIALVITIIVLLILAGVSIAMLTGNNGILTQANTAKTDTATAEEVERINMELNALYSAVMADPTKGQFTPEEIKQVKTNLGDDTKYTVNSGSEEASASVTISAAGISQGTITITSDGNAELVSAKKATN